MNDEQLNRFSRGSATSADAEATPTTSYRQGRGFSSLRKFKTKFGGEPVQVPMTGGMVVFAYNLDGVKDLKLSRTDYCGIASVTKTTALKAVIEWALTTGKSSATELGYLPLDDELVTKAKAELNKAYLTLLTIETHRADGNITPKKY